MPLIPSKPQCLVCRRVREEANKWITVWPAKEGDEGEGVRARFRQFSSVDLEDAEAEFVCGPGKCFLVWAGQEAEEMTRGKMGEGVDSSSAGDVEGDSK